MSLKQDWLYQMRIQIQKYYLKNYKKKIKFKSGSITFGKNGAYTSYGNSIIYSPALTKNPIDTLGAGDAFFVISSIISKISNDPKNRIFRKHCRFLCGKLFRT